MFNGKSRKIKIKLILRRTSQLIFISLFFYRFLSLDFSMNEKLSFSLFFRFDSLLAIFTGISSLYFSKFFIPAFILLFLILLSGNFFCFWICPFGGIIDYSNIFVSRKKWKVHLKIPLYLRKLRFFILGGFILTAFLTLFFKIPHILWTLDPYVILTRAVVLKKWWLFSFLTILIISIFVPRMWCNNICPLGALNFLIGNKLRYFIKNKMRRIKNESK